MKKAVIAAKVLVIISMMCLLFTTYLLRTRILTLVNHLIDSDNVVATERLDRYSESDEDRQAIYEAELTRHEIQMARYRALLKLYQDDPAEYLAQTNEGRVVSAPRVPHKPSPPRTPEVQDQLAAKNVDFRKSRDAYFKMATRFNIFVGTCAVGLVGGILFLLLFDPEKTRITYIVVLVLSFVFIIGPAFHSALTLMAYQLRAPVYLDSGYPPGGFDPYGPDMYR